MPKLKFSIQIVHEESDFYNGFARQCVSEQTKQQIGIFIFADSLYLAPMGAGMGGARAISHCTYEFRSRRFTTIKNWAMWSTLVDFKVDVGRFFVAEGRACWGQVKHVAHAQIL